MSILIKGVEMPKSCWDCELGSAQQLDGKPCPFYSTDYREQKKYSNKRADGCPLVPVPPHGDLIDRDALLEILEEYIDEYSSIDENGLHDLKWCAMMEAMDTTKDAPTIIEAEEGET